jgi:hypothetical protein
MTPVMYVDPNGESLMTIVFLVSLLIIPTVAFIPSDRRPGENISVSGSVFPDPMAVGYEILGNGIKLQHIPEGYTCNMYGECDLFTESNGQFGPLSFGRSQSCNTTTYSASIGIFYFSFDNNLLDISSYSAGLQLEVSGGSPTGGSGSVQIKIDVLGFIKDILGLE